MAAPARELDPGTLPDHTDRLYRAAYALTGSHQDAEDIVQETFERVLRRPRAIRRDDDLAYLLRVLRNTGVARLQAAERRRTAPVAPETLEWVHDPTARPDGAALDARLAYAAIAELSAPLRDAIVAVDVVGLSYSEAARSLRTRTGTIMSRLYRARDQVADRLGAT